MHHFAAALDPVSIDRSFNHDEMTLRVCPQLQSRSARLLWLSLTRLAGSSGLRALIKHCRLLLQLRSLVFDVLRHLRGLLLSGFLFTLARLLLWS